MGLAQIWYPSVVGGCVKNTKDISGVMLERNCIVATKKKRRKLINCADKNCNGKYNLSYENDAPVFTCNTCDKQDLSWKKFYSEYLQLYKEKDNWDVEKHKVTCIIGFFCHMYEGFYGTKYIFVPTNRSPYSCKECKDAWKLLATFKNDAHETRKYIYWVFKKLIRKNTSIVSFGYINSPGIIRKYNLHNLKKHTITRSTKLPDEFISWCRNNVSNLFSQYELSTVNDLGALLSVVKFYNSEELREERMAIQVAERLNLVKDGVLNIKE